MGSPVADLSLMSRPLLLVSAANKQVAFYENSLIEVSIQVDGGAVTRLPDWLSFSLSPFSSLKLSFSTSNDLSSSSGQKYQN
ncbi:hypothetical protein CEXT_729031 [Caerostris extrusa]|uniref:Uncharacterized protein n=1 Tax=Caerostris extrusa TaxID=172846 RepID=A0AAV4PMP8_CAEEX|nr:hypothetical protein CEXT_729031 [Caerostris extrusa]